MLREGDAYFVHLSSHLTLPKHEFAGKVDRHLKVKA